MKPLLNVNTLTNTEELYNMYDQWTALYTLSDWVSPFQSPDWILPWWKYFGNGQPYTFSIVQDDELLFLAPLYIYTHSKTQIRELKFIGTGNTDCMDILCKPGYEIRTIPLLLNSLRTAAHKWDKIDLQGIVSDSPLLKEIVARELSCSIKSDDVSPVLHLPSSSSYFMRSISSKLVYNTERAIRLLEKIGNLTLKLIIDQSITANLDILFDLHQKSWQKRNLSGVLSDSTVQAFLKEMALKLSASQSVRLYLLYMEATAIAAVLMLEKDKKLYYYIGGFNPKFQQFSPGSVLLYKIISQAITQGFSEINFLKGAETYKYKWGAEDIPLFRIIFE